MSTFMETSVRATKLRTTRGIMAAALIALALTILFCVSTGAYAEAAAIEVLPDATVEIWKTEDETVTLKYKCPVNGSYVANKISYAIYETGKTGDPVTVATAAVDANGYSYTKINLDGFERTKDKPANIVYMFLCTDTNNVALAKSEIATIEYYKDNGTSVMPPRDITVKNDNGALVFSWVGRPSDWGLHYTYEKHFGGAAEEIIIPDDTTPPPCEATVSCAGYDLVRFSVDFVETTTNPEGGLGVGYSSGANVVYAMNMPKPVVNISPMSSPSTGKMKIILSNYEYSKSSNTTKVNGKALMPVPSSNVYSIDALKDYDGDNDVTIDVKYTSVDSLCI